MAISQNLINYRINENMLIQLQPVSNNFMDFNEITYPNNNSQFFVDNQLIIDKLIFTDNLWNVIDINHPETQYRVNKVFSNSLVDNTTLNNFTTIQSKKYFDTKLFLKQGFNWNNIFGIGIVIKDSTNPGITYFSGYYKSENFIIADDLTNLLINGTYWNYYIPIKFPRVDTDLDNLIISLYTISFNDVESVSPIGLVYNFPIELTSYEPLISNKPLPDYIQNSIKITDKNLIELSVSTTEQFTSLQQSIYNYLSIPNGQIPTIAIYHRLTYGYNPIGFKTITLQNNDNNYNPIIIGLDLTPFNNSLNQIQLTLVTIITCNGISLNRTTSINYDYTNLYDPLLDLIYGSVPDTSYPVNVEIINTINQNVIETKKEIKIVETKVPVIAQLVTKDFDYAPINIYFDNVNITENCFLVIGDEPITDSKTKLIFPHLADGGKLYFDVKNDVQKPQKTTVYNIYNSDYYVIQTGNIIIK